MSKDNTPVIVGVSQILQRLDDPMEGKEVIDLMVDAVKSAAKDTGNPSLLKEVESLRVIRGVWRYKQPAAYVAEKLGLGNVETVGTPYGGNYVQAVVNQSALEILAGEKSLIVLTGAENGNSQAKARKAGIKLPLTDTPGAYSRFIGNDKPMASENEIARGIAAPIQFYPMFENALRYQQKESISEHRLRISQLWAGFSEVASHNPNAWIRDKVNAETIRTASQSNRMISFPYPKMMNSNSAVDMASALILCSVKKAKELGIPESSWVYPLSGTDAQDTQFVSNRDNLYSSPAIRIAGNRSLEMLDMTVADVDMIDVYSCFPSAVQVAINELGLDISKPLTVTGGLTFGGGPLNNYVMHSISTMVELLRASPGKKGMITANGGMLTKHAFGIYSTEAPENDFQYDDCQDEVDLSPRRESVDDHTGDVTVETYTVMYDAEGPKVAHAACLLPDGRRTWANNFDSDTMGEMMVDEFCGRTVSLNSGGKFSI
ncbi:MAG: acetyl-CoA C-acetyltransferase [Candidatus Azotimanducaceae bacterium]|jgi:acetyl-CoA C-acetyltransferase